MNRIHLGPLRDIDNPRPIEISRDRAGTLTEMIGLVSLEPVERQLVFLGKDRDSLDAELGCRAEDADRNLAAIGNEDSAN